MTDVPETNARNMASISVTCDMGLRADARYNTNCEKLSCKTRC